MRLVSFTPLLVLSLFNCTTDDASTATGSDDVAGKADSDAELATGAGWRIDGRVSPQVGVFFGRDGSADKARLSRFQVLSPLALPAAALTGNGVPLFDVRPDDTAQIDFYLPHSLERRRLGLDTMLDAHVARFALDPATEHALGPALARRDVVLKEVRLLEPGEAPLAAELSALPANPLVAYDSVAYVTVFVTKLDARAELGALAAFRAQVSAGEPSYEVGEIAALPAIPHPQDSSLALTGLLTLRATDPLQGKRFVLEVIETE